jgi:acyl carrier protein
MATIKIVLGTDIGTEVSLMSSGLDSLGAVELRKELASVTGLELPTTLVHDYPTVNSITDLILSMLTALTSPGPYHIIVCDYIPFLTM